MKSRWVITRIPRGVRQDISVDKLYCLNHREGFCDSDSAMTDGRLLAAVTVGETRFSGSQARGVRIQSGLSIGWVYRCHRTG